MFAGFERGTINTSLFRANTCGCPAAKAASTTRFICASFAEAKTSAGAPWAICPASVSDPPKLYVTAILVFFVNAGAAASNASRREAAAKTVILPESAAEGRLAPSMKQLDAMTREKRWSVRRFVWVEAALKTYDSFARIV